MSFIKRNCTIVVLVAIIISALASSFLAAPTIIDDIRYPDEIIIQNKRHDGAYPQAIQVLFDTRSETRAHHSLIWIICEECNISVWDMNPYAELDPNEIEIVYRFPVECWRQDHYKVLYRVY